MSGPLPPPNQGPLPPSSPGPMQTHFDPPHAGKPAHAGFVLPLNNGIKGAGAHKLEIGPNGEIITDDIV